MEVSALKYSGGIRLHGRSSLLRLQSDDRLISLVRRGNVTAFEVLVGRYETRLLAFCRHLLGSREDAEDVLQEVFTAAFNALLADDRPINARPWLFRIARNRSLNHLRRTQAIGVDSMDVHYSEHGASTADKVHDREEFRLLVGDIHELPESQKTALVLREMDALSYEQIAEVMETTVPSVKSLLVRARVSLAEAAEARLLSCDEVRIELGEIAEGLRRRPSPLVRRHLKSCTRCGRFKVQLRQTNRALAALLPIGPLAVLRKIAWAHLPHSAGSSTGVGAAAGSTAVAGGTAAAGSTAGGIATVGLGAVATKAAVGLAAAALVTGAAVEVHHLSTPAPHTATAPLASTHQPVTSSGSGNGSGGASPSSLAAATTRRSARHSATKKATAKRKQKKTTGSNTTTLVASTTPPPATTTTTTTSTPSPTPPAPGRDQTQTDPTVLASPTDTTATTTTAPSASSNPTGTTTTIAPVVPVPTTTTGATTTTTTTTTTPPPPPIATQ
ncbi:MAG TPA: sigma-70 family RNA polymerase sigma factor [Solirubrobacteraceae bacterium]|nr:sigma-70 family RNA polymerase sigma factor [Solirubrobacteraceae bacterium]